MLQEQLACWYDASERWLPRFLTETEFYNLFSCFLQKQEEMPVAPQGGAARLAQSWCKEMKRGPWMQYPLKPSTGVLLEHGCAGHQCPWGGHPSCWEGSWPSRAFPKAWEGSSWFLQGMPKDTGAGNYFNPALVQPLSSCTLYYWLEGAVDSLMFTLRNVKKAGWRDSVAVDRN